MLLVSGPVAWLVFEAAARRPDLVESVYARRVYPVLDALLGWTGTHHAPYAIAEVLGLLLGLGCLMALGWWCVGCVRQPREAARKLVRALPVYACTASALYAAFVASWGLNYRRPPLAETLRWPTAAPRVEELRMLAMDLVPRVNALRKDLRFEADLRATAERAELGFARLGEALAPALSARETSPVRPAILSRAMSSSLTYGMTLPWTHEAILNCTTPLPAVPATLCHEMAHQRGIAREDEAGFVGYLAGRLHPDPHFRYSALRFALAECLAALSRVDPAAATDLAARRDPAVIADASEEAAWAMARRSAFSRGQIRVYDGYLKAQGQPEGLRSYGRVVDLLIAEQRLRQSGKLPDSLK